MKQIVSPNSLVSKVLGKQKTLLKKYRPLTHLLYNVVDEGLLIYNSLTGALIILSEDEAVDFKSGNICSSPIFEQLISDWFLVPTDNDDNQLCDNINNMMFMIADSDKHPPITKYTIFTTTDCNARCFYCFEMKRSRIHMSEQTAHDVASFIYRSCKGNAVNIRWFGGEPLYNSKVIDIICDDLKKYGVEFYSSMVSNGYLFDEQIVYKAKNIWNLSKVKIAVDGTEEIYNKYKAFIYNDGSAFKRVMNNIGLLLSNGMDVIVRLNMDNHNVDDLYNLADYLHERFAEYNNLTFDLHLLLENSTDVQINRGDDERHLLMDKHKNLQKYLNRYLPEIKYDLSKVRRWKQCMADDNAATTVLPDGHLGKCDYYTEDGFWGSIYSDEINEAEIARFKKSSRPNGGSKCDSCPIRPICYKLDLCSDKVTRCDEYDQKRSIDLMNSCILNAYRNREE